MHFMHVEMEDCLAAKCTRIWKTQGLSGEVTCFPYGLGPCL